MIAKIISAAAITIFLTAAPALFSQEHPEHPEHPKAGGAKKQVSTADISAGIKKNITTDTNTNTNTNTKNKIKNMTKKVIK